MSLIIQITSVPISVQITPVSGSVDQVDVSLSTAPIQVQLDAIGSSGPPGPPVAYLHPQPTPSSIWTINHNLGYRPDVSCRNAGSQEIEGEVVHPSMNQALVYFAVAVSGEARCL